MMKIPDLIPRFWSITLGPENGIIVWNNYVHIGKMGAISKKLIEKLYVGSARDSKIAKMSLTALYA
jgi:hypothetical protein